MKIFDISAQGKHFLRKIKLFSLAAGGMTKQFATNDLLHVFFVFVLGNARKCNVCRYWTSQPKEQQKCNITLTCPLGLDYCYTLSGTYQNGTDVVEKNCANSGLCSVSEKACNSLTTRLGLKSCAFECCNTNNCNSHATGVMVTSMVTKFTLSLMAIVGFIFA